LVIKRRSVCGTGRDSVLARRIAADQRFAVEHGSVSGLAFCNEQSWIVRLAVDPYIALRGFISALRGFRESNNEVCAKHSNFSPRRFSWLKTVKPGRLLEDVVDAAAAA
jgi:hypothetical protein